MSSRKSATRALACEANLGETVTKLSRDDVIMGRGTMPTEYEGNKRLRRIVADYRQMYVGSNKHKPKQEIALAILGTVKARGGRFLVRVDEESNTTMSGSSPTKDWIIWRTVLDQSLLIEKIKQMMRDQDPETKYKRRERKRKPKPIPPTATTPAIAGPADSGNQYHSSQEISSSGSEPGSTSIVDDRFSGTNVHLPSHSVSTVSVAQPAGASANPSLYPGLQTSFFDSHAAQSTSPLLQGQHGQLLPTGQPWYASLPHGLSQEETFLHLANAIGQPLPLLHLLLQQASPTAAPVSNTLAETPQSQERFGSVPLSIDGSFSPVAISPQLLEQYQLQNIAMIAASLGLTPSQLLTLLQPRPQEYSTEK
jgi:hypothetical protein